MIRPQQQQWIFLPPSHSTVELLSHLLRPPRFPGSWDSSCIFAREDEKADWSSCTDNHLYVRKLDPDGKSFRMTRCDNLAPDKRRLLGTAITQLQYANEIKVFQCLPSHPSARYGQRHYEKLERRLTKDLNTFKPRKHSVALPFLALKNCGIVVKLPAVGNVRQ